MKITKDQLETPFSKLFPKAENDETPRQFIRKSEEVFGLPQKDIDRMGDGELNRYIEKLDYLWMK